MVMQEGGGDPSGALPRGYRAILESSPVIPEEGNFLCNYRKCYLETCLFPKETSDRELLIYLFVSSEFEITVKKREQLDNCFGKHYPLFQSLSITCCLNAHERLFEIIFVTFFFSRCYSLLPVSRLCSGRTRRLPTFSHHPTCD